MKNPRVARRYANALMQVAVATKAVDRTAEDLGLVGRALKGSRELWLLLASPVVPETKKASIVNEMFGKRVSAPTMMFLDLLVRKHREVVLDEVIEQFHALHDEMLGLITVDVKTAVDLQPKQEKTLIAELERRTGKKVRLQVTRDPSIMGGLMVKIGDTVVDASVRHQLARLHESFTGTSASMA